VNLRSAFTALSTGAARLATRHALPVIIVTGLLAVVGAALAVQLQPRTGIESLVGSKSRTYDKTREHAKVFGADPVIILVEGELPKIVLSPDIAKLSGLEGCISGNIPPKELENPETPRICKLFARKKYARVVYGPGTFVNTAATSLRDQIGTQVDRARRKAEKAAEAAQKLAQARGLPPEEQQQLAEQAEELSKFESLRSSLEVGAKYGLSVTNPPALTNPEFVARLVFDATRSYDQPKARFAYLFPNKRSAIVQVRLREGLTDAQTREAVEAIRIATQEPRFALDNGTYTVTGAPALLAGVEDAIARSARILLLVALLLMALTLFFVFPAELRLLPLALALMAAALAFGLLYVSGAGLGVGALAVLPVLIGLAVDYAIQFQYRIDRRRERGDGLEAVVDGARSGAVPVFAAACTTLAALAALALSPVPLVRGFGALLATGVVLALVLVITTGFGVLAWAGGAKRPKRDRRPAAHVARWLRFDQVSAWLQRHRRALPVLVGLALVGWILGAFGPVKSDVTELVPSSVEEVGDIESLRDATGTAGELAVLVRAKDVTDPKVLTWMRDYQKKVLTAAGYGGEKPSCAGADLCPALSLTDLFAGQKLTRKQVRALFETVPYYAQALVSEDRTKGNIAFGLRPRSLSEQSDVIQMMRDRLDPPKGVEADVVGLTVLGADAGDRLGSWWRRLLIPALALSLVLLVLWAVLRRWRLVLAPVVTVFAAAGLAELLLGVTRIDLNPLSVSLNVFVIAITAEFTSLVYLQYLRERERDDEYGGADGADGHDLPAMYRAALRTTGPALFASAATALVGFATLAASNINLLRGFATVAVVDLAAALAGALLILPLAIGWIERRGRRGGGEADETEAAAEQA
jgi:predicted RND superfamily exporter protein